MRTTRQRAAILRALRCSGDHPTAEAVHAQVRRELPHVSLGTVYRVLNGLVQQGEASLLTMGSGPARYDGRPGGHSHVACLQCGQMADVPELLEPGARTEVERWTGYSVGYARLVWYGTCSACRAAPSAPTAAGREPGTTDPLLPGKQAG